MKTKQQIEAEIKRRNPNWTKDEIAMAVEDQMEAEANKNWYEDSGLAEANGGRDE